MYAKCVSLIGVNVKMNWNDLHATWINARLPTYRWSDECPKCHFCHANYTSIDDVRESVKCPMCLGMASVAKELTVALQARLDDCRQRGDINGLREIVEMTHGSYFAFESRISIRRIRKGVNKHQDKQLELFGGSDDD